MSSVEKYAWLGACCLLAVGSVAAQTLNTNIRLVLEKSKDARWPAEVGRATVWPVGLDPKTCSVTITTEAGKPIGAEILWSEPGEPLKIIFDTSSHATRFLLDLSATPSGSAPAWKPPEVGCRFEVRDFLGGPMETVDQVKADWKQATHLQGRGYVPNIFLGVNPFGPSENFIALFDGRLVVPADGDYHFATVSDDASVLMIDGQTVASWPGGHGADARAYLEHAGQVNLTAGVHRIEYLWIQIGGGLAAVAAWQPAGQERYEVIPPEAFVPIAQFETVEAATPTAYFEWKPVDQSAVDDLALVDYRFRVRSAVSNLTFQWTFDDKTTARGPMVTHLFLRPALRHVRLDVIDHGQVEFTVNQDINVHRPWEQLSEWSDDHFENQRATILKLDLTQLPLLDLANATRVADAIHDEELLTNLGLVCVQRHQDFSHGEQADLFYVLGGHFESPHVRRYDDAEHALQAASELQSKDANLHERIKLRLARLLLDTFGKTDETGKLLETVKADNLDDDERRMLVILRADLLLARGDVEGARAKYQAISRLGERDPKVHMVQRQARLESARAYLVRKDYETAETIVRTVEWEDPVERLAPEFNLVQIKIGMARQEYPRAMFRCQRLLLVTKDDNLLAETLFNLVEIERAMKLDQLAGQTLAQLLEKHPYSESAALAKERWGNESTRK